MEMPRPNPAILAKKDRIVRRLQAVLQDDAVIHDLAETRAYECDALTAYKCPPLCAVLPSNTSEVSAVLKICHEEGVPVVPRGSGTSLAGGALPTADAVILGVARMNDVLEVDYDCRFIRVQTGRTNLSVTGAIEEDGPVLHGGQLQRGDVHGDCSWASVSPASNQPVAGAAAGCSCACRP